MTDLLPDHLFADPIWPALLGPHRHLAVGTGLACRYPADVAVFAALAEPTEVAISERISLAMERDHMRVIRAPVDNVSVIMGVSCRHDDDSL